MRPVLVGDEVSVYAEVVAAGRTSLRIAVETWRRVRAGAEHEKVTEAGFTFVAVDGERRPRPLPAGEGALLPATGIVVGGMKSD